MSEDVKEGWTQRVEDFSTCVGGTRDGTETVPSSWVWNGRLENLCNSKFYTKGNCILN